MSSTGASATPNSLSRMFLQMIVQESQMHHVFTGDELLDLVGSLTAKGAAELGFASREDAHRPNENKISRRRRQRAWLPMDVFP